MPAAMRQRRSSKRKLRYELHPAQLAFFRSRALYRGFVGGIGSGKSWVGAFDLLARTQPGRLYMVIAPTYRMLQDACLRTFLKVAREAKHLRSFVRGDMMATLHDGSEILFRSADDPERLRGPNLSGVWLDEASLMPREAWDITIGRLRESGQQGWCSATFTPKGRSHWTYDVFGKSTPGTELFHARTADNPFNPRTFEQTLRHQYAGLLAQQELDGLFLDVQGAEWSAEYFPDSMWFENWPRTLTCRVVALDPSKGKGARHGDYSAFVRLGRAVDGALYIQGDLRNDRDSSRIVADGLAHARTFRPDVFAVETNAYQELLADDFARQSRENGVMLPLFGINNYVNKEVRIRRLTPFLSRGLLRFKARCPGTELLVQQLRDFPEGDHDDGPDALEMAIRSMSEYLSLRLDAGTEEALSA